MLAHVMGMPVEESILQLAPAGAAMVTAVAIRRSGEPRPADAPASTPAARRRSLAEEDQRPRAQCLHRGEAICHHLAVAIRSMRGHGFSAVAETAVTHRYAVSRGFVCGPA